MSSWFEFISDPMARALVFLAQSLGDNAGLAIIVFTIGIKLLLVPLTLQQLKSARAMQEAQPLIQELQRKHKGDKQKLTEETMALYKEHHVNPAAGCLPLIVQLPILYGLYGALSALGNASHAQYSPLFAQSFLWLNGSEVVAGITHTGLGAPDPWHILPVFCVDLAMGPAAHDADPEADRSSAGGHAGHDAVHAADDRCIFVEPGSRLAVVLGCIDDVQHRPAVLHHRLGQLFHMPSLGGLSGLLGGPSQNGASRNGAQPRKAAPRASKPAPRAAATKARTRRGQSPAPKGT